MPARPALLALALLACFACRGEEIDPGEIQGSRRPDAPRHAQAEAQAAAGRALGALASAPPDKRILFGDLHVHTTYSIDAFVYALPIFAGEGAHPPADACDFARYCSQLDFFSMNDHAEALTASMWTTTKQSLRECNERAGDPEDPDLVAFVGWEWTQVGRTPETHYGHKNVIFPGLAEDELPRRPITALEHDVMDRARGLWFLPALQALRYVGLREYADFLWHIQQLAALPTCEVGRDTRELPDDCRESAPTPGELFEKLAQWGFETIVIPHGLAWGVHAPQGGTLDAQLLRAQHDPGRQILLETFSGHGNSEEFRDVPEYALDASGERLCPEPTPEYLPCCWRAGELIRERCGDLPAEECESRVREAQQLVMRAGTKTHWVVPDAEQEEWLDCDQCRDCFKPAFILRPGMSAQYGAALSNFDELDAEGRPLRFRWGFISSSDNHSGRPGTGYKQFGRLEMTDARGASSEAAARRISRIARGSAEDPRRAAEVVPAPPGFRDLFDVERGASFMYPGGLVAVHSEGRDRRAIWNALERREVYGTSGPRILLWFDLMNGPGGRSAMGSQVSLEQAPRFEVRAVGSFLQQPGCSEESEQALAPERLAYLCHGQCYHPAEQRHRITRIEVVRIRPQARPGEEIARLIEDPWRSFDCPEDPAGCRIEFDDPEFADSGRDAVYYVRALQEPTPAVNGAQLRTRFDAEGRATRVTPCYGDPRTPSDDDCLAPVAERAWSSPIYVDRKRAEPARSEPLASEVHSGRP
jgi:hypothetical protein